MDDAVSGVTVSVWGDAITDDIVSGRSFPFGGIARFPSPGLKTPGYKQRDP